MITALRSAKLTPGILNVALSTAHPVKIDRAVEMTLTEEKEFQFRGILFPQFVGLESLLRRIIHGQRRGELDDIRKIIMNEMKRKFSRALS
jgi:hypothetical protein